MKPPAKIRRIRLPLVLLGNALLRIAGGAGGILVGLYLADLANRGSKVDVAIVGTLGAISFLAELVGALPMGCFRMRLRHVGRWHVGYGLARRLCA